MPPLRSLAASPLQGALAPVAQRSQLNIHRHGGISMLNGSQEKKKGECRGAPRFVRLRIRPSEENKVGTRARRALAFGFASVNVDLGPYRDLDKIDGIRWLGFTRYTTCDAHSTVPYHVSE